MKTLIEMVEQSGIDKLEDLKLIEVEREKGKVNRYHLPVVTVPISDTPAYQILEQGVPDSDTELDQRTTTSSNEDARPLLFEAFYEFWTRKPYTPSVVLTKSERGRLNAAAKEAQLARITPQEVKRRGVEYRVLWPNLEATPQALLANWSRFEPPPSKDPCDICGDAGVFWVDGQGNQVPGDSLDAVGAVKCSHPARGVAE